MKIAVALLLFVAVALPASAQSPPPAGPAPAKPPAAADKRQPPAKAPAQKIDARAVLQQRTAQKLTFPVLHGGGLRISYGVETTPKIVLIDAGGVVRGAWLGWGAETAGEVRAELQLWLRPN